MGCGIERRRSYITLRLRSKIAVCEVGNVGSVCLLLRSQRNPYTVTIQSKMSQLKRSYSQSSSYGPRKKSKYTGMSRVPRGPRVGTSTIVKRACYTDITSGSADYNGGFGWSPTTLWKDGASVSSIDGASDMTNMFDVCRVKMVEVIICPYGSVHEFANDSSTSKALPICYIAADTTDSTNPSSTSILQYDRLHITTLDHVVRYKCYPKMATGSGSISLTRRDWAITGTDIPAFGVKIHVDWPAAQVSLTGFRINFIVTYECKDTK